MSAGPVSLELQCKYDSGYFDTWYQKRSPHLYTAMWHLFLLFQKQRQKAKTGQDWLLQWRRVGKSMDVTIGSYYSLVNWAWDDYVKQNTITHNKWTNKEIILIGSMNVQHTHTGFGFSGECSDVNVRLVFSNPLTPVLAFVYYIISFDQNWHHLYSTSTGGNGLSNDTQIRVIGSVES